MSGILLGLAVIFGAALGWSAVVACIGMVVIASIVRGRSDLWTAALLICALLGCLRVSGREAAVIPIWVDGEQLLVGTVSSGPVESGRAQRFNLSARPDGVDGDENTTATLCASAPVLPALNYGDQIQLSGTIQRLDMEDSSTAGYLRSRGCVGSLQIHQMSVTRPGRGIHAQFDRIRRKMTASLQASFPGDSGALMAGLVTGDDAGLSAEQRDAFIVTGTSHVTAVSGSNLAVIVILLTMIGSFARYGRSFWWQLLVVAALWGYVAIIGLSPPPFRAACVATLALGAIRIGRKPDFVTLSVLVAAAELMFRPADFDSLAYRLSTISAIALVLGLWRRSPQGLKGWFGHGVIATAVTQAATSPLLIPTFGRFTLYAIPANVIVGPLCAIAFPFVLIAGLIGLVSSTAATIVAAPAVLPVEISLRAVTATAALPYADSGSSIASAVPAWAWSAIAILAVISLSRECRGGIVRLAGELRLMDRRRQAILSCATASAIVGTIAGLWAR